MSATLTDDTKVNVAFTIRFSLNAGGDGNPIILIGTSSASVVGGVLSGILASMPVPSPVVFSSASGFAGFMSFATGGLHATATATGTAAVALWCTRTGGVAINEVFRCGVGTSGGDLIINKTSIVTGDDVEISTANVFYQCCP